MGCVRPDGYPMTIVTWYDWEDGRVLINMDERRNRLPWIKRDPHVSFTVFDDDWYRHVSFTGDVVETHDDADLADIDRLAVRYTGRPFRNRKAKRVSAWIEPRHWHVWELDGK
jgi:PPOX class probable F420-dependent enzyme